MRKSCFLICAALVLMLLGGCTGETVCVEKGGCVFDGFVTTDMAGAPVSQEIFRGHRLTMVNIWATFCNPCVKEMPDLVRLQEEFGEDLQIIGIVADAADRNGNVLPEKKAEAAAIIQATGAAYPHLLPSKSLNKAYLDGVQSVPETVFVDEDGNRIGGRYLGARDLDAWRKIVTAMLESLP